MTRLRRLRLTLKTAVASALLGAGAIGMSPYPVWMHEGVRHLL
jgi:hypothetical protein